MSLEHVTREEFELYQKIQARTDYANYLYHEAKRYFDRSFRAGALVLLCGGMAGYEFYNHHPIIASAFILAGTITGFIAYEDYKMYLDSNQRTDQQSSELSELRKQLNNLSQKK